VDMKHDCGRAINGRREWPMCTACDGRMHMTGCTTRKNPKVDCCYLRHKKLHDAGQRVGIYDSSVPMLVDEDCWK